MYYSLCQRHPSPDILHFFQVSAQVYVIDGSLLFNLSELASASTLTLFFFVMLQCS